MINGSYREKVDWRTFESPGAYHLFEQRSTGHSSNEYRTCGSGALSLLTGFNPKNVEKKLPKSAEHWSDFAIVRYLKHRKFMVTQLSKYGVTNLDADNSDFEMTPLNRRHVLLCCLLVCRNEASWFVITNGRVFHNFEEKDLDPLFFVNKPSQSSYLVSHRSWRYST